MTHNEKRTNWWKEGLFGLSTGIIYGVTSVLVGHPFDTIKTKMQAEPTYQRGMIHAFKHCIKTQGIRGLYSGAVGPLWGSGIYRSTQFAVFEALYTKWDKSHTCLKSEIPLTSGLQLRVIGAGFVASTARAIIECPIEYAKVNRQTSQSWKLSKVYKGFTFQWVRTSGVMVTYFCLIDSIRRNYPQVFSQPAGQFLASSMSATIGFWLVWPAEVLKNQIQANTPIKGIPNPTVLDRCKELSKSHGLLRGLYRGILPGTYRAFFSNGFSMIAMAFAQRKATELGLR